MMDVNNVFDDFIIRGRKYGRYKIVTKNGKLISEELYCYNPFGAEGEIITYERE